jgi:hypothetical protein
MKKRHWIVAGLAASAGGALFYVLRCRHAQTSFPISREGLTYITCLKCGLHRLYDPESMQAYGPWTDTPAGAVEGATIVAIKKGLAPDRRATARVRKRASVKAKTTKSGEEDQAAETRDLSERGLFLFTNLPVEADTDLQLILTLPPEVTKGTPTLVCAHGKVVRVEKAKGKRTGVAVAIERIEPLPQV